MTGPDWVGMYGMAFSASIAILALLITIMSGYLVVAYLVGKQLTRVQIFVTNTLYLMSAFTIILGNFQASLDVQIAYRQAALQIPELVLTDSSSSIFILPVSIVVINVCLVIASLIFMWQVRHPKKS